MGKYIVIEMQNGIIGSNSWAYDDRPSAEVKLYQVLSEVVKSPVETHTVMLVTNDGFVLDTKTYSHPVAPEPEPAPEPETETENVTNELDSTTPEVI